MICIWKFRTESFWHAELGVGSPLQSVFLHCSFSQFDLFQNQWIHTNLTKETGLIFWSPINSLRWSYRRAFKSVSEQVKSSSLWLSENNIDHARSSRTFPVSSDASVWEAWWNTCHWGWSGHSYWTTSHLKGGEKETLEPSLDCFSTVVQMAIVVTVLTRQVFGTVEVVFPVIVSVAGWKGQTRWLSA